MRPLASLLAAAVVWGLSSSALADAAPSEPIETAIEVPSPIPVGWLVAWKPAILSVRVDNGAGSQFGSDKLQPLRGLVRYTGTLLNEKLLARAELEGGRFETDQQGSNLGTDGYDVTLRLLGGTATHITQAFTITASAGFLTRYQNGRPQGGAPSLGFAGVTSNVEFEYRFAPLISASLYLEGGLAPFPYAAEARLGNLRDASEFRGRLQLSVDLTASSAVDIGYDYTRWHLSFTQVPGGTAGTTQAELIEAREHALTIGYRWKG